MALLRYAAKFDSYLSLYCAPTLHPGTIQGKEGIKFCHLATLSADYTDNVKCTGKIFFNSTPNFQNKIWLQIKSALSASKSFYSTDLAKLMSEVESEVRDTLLPMESELKFAVEGSEVGQREMSWRKSVSKATHFHNESQHPKNAS